MNSSQDEGEKLADRIPVDLEKLTYGGAALGHLPDGRAVFVPFALPGERVLIRPVEQKRGHVRAALVEVLSPSAQRIHPRCIHFGICGGCAYQHLPYPDQLTVKRDILRDQLERIGRIPAPPVQATIPSPHEWNYRNQVQFHLASSGKLGYIGTDDRSIVPISECHLPEGTLCEIWPRLSFDPGLQLERVSLRLGIDDEVMLVLESDEIPELELEAGLSVVHLNQGQAVVMAGDPALIMKVLDRTFRVSAASFFQVNTSMAESMVKHLLERLPLQPGAVVCDIYCGAGLFSAFFAARAGRLIGVEVSPSACDDFTFNLDEFDNVELYEAPAETVLPALDVKPDAMIVDPPRAGLHRRALEAICRLAPNTLAYVSCDPSTLARDARHLLDAGYRLIEVTPFDLFPQTFHIESISIFARDHQGSDSFSVNPPQPQ